MEIRDVVAEEFMICFIHADETYRQMAHRDLLEGKVLCRFKNNIRQSEVAKEQDNTDYCNDDARR